MKAQSLPIRKLEPVEHFVSRPLSSWEYFQASSGAHPQTLEAGREIITVCEGHGTLDPTLWQRALTRAIQKNPACRIRLTGKRQKSRWLGDGDGPTLRVIHHSDWKGDHSQAEAFIKETPLSLECGFTSELILVHARRSYVIFRVHHAVMDGLGAVHFVQEIFRALRGEPLLGTNATFSDTELTADITPEKSAWLSSRCAHATGKVRGSDRGNSWSRISLTDRRPKLLAQTALAVAEYARRFSEKPARIAIPVNLRRYKPDIVSTMNYTSIMYVDVRTSDSLDTIDRSIKSALKEHAEMAFFQMLKLCKYLPLSWFDILTARTEKNYRKGKILQTAFISNIGALCSADFCGGGFTAERFFIIPLQGVTYIILSTLDDNVEVAVGLPDVYASDGRLEQFTQFIQQRLQSIP